MKCINPKMKELVGLYQFDLLGGEDKLKAEAHLLECDACFGEVYRFSPTVKMMEEKPEFFLNSLQPKDSSTKEIFKLFKRINHLLINLMNGIFYVFKNWWHRPVVKILVPVAALAIILLIIASPDTKKNFELTLGENVSSLALKAKDFVEEPQMIFNQGVKNFQEENYPEAIQNFDHYLKKKKKDAYAHYYLGVSLVLTENIEKGIENLETASKLCKKQRKEILLEKCYWELGNAYLKNNNSEKALKSFRSIVAIGGKFKDNALRQMMRIEDR